MAWDFFKSIQTYCKNTHLARRTRDFKQTAWICIETCRSISIDLTHILTITMIGSTAMFLLLDILLVILFLFQIFQDLFRTVTQMDTEMIHQLQDRKSVV